MNPYKKFILPALFFMLIIMMIALPPMPIKKNSQQIGGIEQYPALGKEIAGLPLAPPFTITAEFQDPDYLASIGFPHTGMDLTKHYGATIYSILDAEVLATESSKPKNGFLGNTAGANYVITRTKIGEEYFFVYYWHLDTATIPVGTFVKKGDAIGIQGNSGYSSGSHLHLEIRKSSNPILPNPGKLQNSNTPINPRSIIDFSKNK